MEAHGLRGAVSAVAHLCYDSWVHHGSRRCFLLIDWTMPGDRGAKNRDKHVHLISLAGDERSSEERAKAPDMTMVLAGVFHLPQYLDAGVTTVHDNGMRQPCPSNF